ncbi:hypothetical protein PUN28_017660 [Cardiocondyla obscurior]|uniref:Uncharacterized protein n=1 Tax=Cardiocondyla obscurior TaxID=286306 RepID=A0AAW2EMQ0_9HYME
MKRDKCARSSLSSAKKTYVSITFHDSFCEMRKQEFFRDCRIPQFQHRSYIRNGSKTLKRNNKNCKF